VKQASIIGFFIIHLGDSTLGLSWLKMEPCDFNEVFPCFNLRRIERYPNPIPLAWRINVPKFGNEPLHASQYILSFLEYVWNLGVTHEDILICPFFFSLDGRKRDLVKNDISPGTISSCEDFIGIFF